MLVNISCSSSAKSENASDNSSRPELIDYAMKLLCCDEQLTSQLTLMREGYCCERNRFDIAGHDERWSKFALDGAAL